MFNLELTKVRTIVGTIRYKIFFIYKEVFFPKHVDDGHWLLLVQNYRYNLEPINKFQLSPFKERILCLV